MEEDCNHERVHTHARTRAHARARTHTVDGTYQILYSSSILEKVYMTLCFCVMALYSCRGNCVCIIYRYLLLLQGSMIAKCPQILSVL